MDDDKAKAKSNQQKKKMSDENCNVRCEVLKPALTQKVISITTKSRS